MEELREVGLQAGIHVPREHRWGQALVHRLQQDPGGQRGQDVRGGGRGPQDGRGLLRGHAWAWA